jgi:Raf kinase inhibitor-like YbhB/YbcL family protein
MNGIFVTTAGLALALSASADGRLQLSSSQVQEGKTLGPAQVYKGFGCEGGNASPALEWRNLPPGTRSIAITVFDPDAPTGSGFWHWLVYDIPADTSGLSAGSTAATLPRGAVQARNDFGLAEYSGACPPPGDKPHRYVFTVYALAVEHLRVPANATAAMIGPGLNGQAMARASLTATYGR